MFCKNFVTSSSKGFNSFKLGPVSDPNNVPVENLM